MLTDDLPAEIAHMGSKAISLYLKALQEGRSPVYRLSVLLTGAYGVGKTCIARRMLEQSIADVSSTNGIDVHINKCTAAVTDLAWYTGRGQTLAYYLDISLY
jgi:Cdc6-like AAA superfamily ATPase